VYYEYYSNVSGASGKPRTRSFAHLLGGEKIAESAEKMAIAGSSYGQTGRCFFVESNIYGSSGK